MSDRDDRMNIDDTVGNEPSSLAKQLSREDVRNLVYEIAEDYLEAFKPPFSTLQDLNGTQRQELFDVVSHRLGRPMNREAWRVLEDRPNITVDDIVDAYFTE